MVPARHRQHQENRHRPQDIKAIFISHGHIDHWGGIDRMHELTARPSMPPKKTGR
jgi:glyoxylase-like metal-dependent hydrolase (beta-lactamase superfamily II)